MASHAQARNISLDTLPDGMVDRHGAARMFGVSIDVWKRWQSHGWVRCGKWVPAEGWPGGRRRVFPVADLERLTETLRSKGELNANESPAGYVERDEAARILGIGPKTIALWFTTGRLRCGKWFRPMGGKRRKIYPIEELKRLKEALERNELPEGYVDTDGACAMFGVTKAAWQIWKRAGKVPRGTFGHDGIRKHACVYAVKDLLRLKEKMRGAKAIFMEGGGSGQWHIPEGWIRIQDACEMFGVHENTWRRWEREKLITCGKQFTVRRLKLYPLETLKRLLEECGRYEPPYPDPNRPGVYRVPLAGEDIHRREAIIDAEDLPIVQGKRWHCTMGEEDYRGQVCTFNGDGESRLHSRIMGVSGTGCLVGHRNSDQLDCRRANLIVRTRGESAANARKMCSFRGEACTSRFKGVCWDRKRETWVVHIKKDGKQKHLGRFGDEIAAAEAYDEAAKQYFGEHARLNFPDGVDAYLERIVAEGDDRRSRVAA